MDKNFVDIQYVICECGDNFPNEKLLNFHLVNDHADEDTFQCEYSTESQDDSIEAGTQPIDEAVMAPIKEEETKHKVYLKAPEGVTYFKCDLCKILYPSKKAYDSHCNKKHSGAQFGFQFIEQDLEGPILPPPPKQKDFHCELCNRTFVGKRSYSCHYRLAHRPHPRLVKAKRAFVCECEICGRKFITKDALVRHRRTHTGEKPYQCSECPKRYRVHEHLQIHRRTHTGERPFKCIHCPKAFIRKCSLNRHDRVHTGEKPFMCPHCGNCFTQSNGLKRHVDTFHLKLQSAIGGKGVNKYV